METVTSADGTSIAFERSGSGPPFVLVHGTTADHTRWEPVLSAFEEYFTVYALDRRGRGESGDAAKYDLKREFEDVAAVVDSIDETVVLLGHSYGALCSLEASLRTDNLRALVLYEPPIPVGGHEISQEDELAEMASLLDGGEDEQALVLFLNEIADIPSAQIDALRAAPNWQDRVDAAHTASRETRAPDNYHFDPARFEQMTAPTLLLMGGESPRWFKDAVEMVADALSDSRIVVLEGQEHVAMNTAPDLFVAAVLSFIDDLNPHAD
ncbi:alpha/beta fold hydrolase [Natronorubrum halophilum]|uniref:alpha/beta fold hydrolase n=1 Tax=Natronorubrum halophilum TaxID=1702106 RepID=UPI000EF70BBE|nr:alpha/beta hydrolase [Natronorubrum halophilum]